MPFAEVIGDPIGHSKSPVIHCHWLAELGVDGEYRATRVQRGELEDYVAQRRADADWRGCNVTIPHKEAVTRLLDEVSPQAEAIGAVNCVVRQGERLVGYNTDVDGIAAALGGKPLGSRHVAIIGAGGAARAMIGYLGARAPAQVTVLARDPGKAQALRSMSNGFDLRIADMNLARQALERTALIVNASPMGMDGCDAMPEDLLSAIAANARGTILFDMVYQPLETEFLRRGAAAGGEPVDGLSMLIGQARSAFERFFRSEPPADSGELRKTLADLGKPIESI